MKVVIADSLPPDSLQELSRFEGLRVMDRSSIPRRELLRELGDAAGLVVRSATSVDRELLGRAPGLKVVGRAGSGVDNIDLAAAREQGVVVMNTPGGNAQAAAELTIGMMFAVCRSIPAADASVKSGLWERKRFVGTQLHGKTLGLIGLGNVGRVVAVFARGMAMQVLAHDPYVFQEVAQAAGVVLSRLDRLLEEAHIVSIHAPRTDDTEGMIASRELGLMRDGAFLLNCARGGIVVESALMAALRSGKLAGIGLDVYDPEPPVDRALLQDPRVVCTPHIGAQSLEAQQQVALMIATQVGRFLTTGEAVNTV